VHSEAAADFLALNAAQAHYEIPNRMRTMFGRAHSNAQKQLRFRVMQHFLAVLPKRLLTYLGGIQHRSTGARHQRRHVQGLAGHRRTSEVTEVLFTDLGMSMSLARERDTSIAVPRILAK